jgi:glucose/arabinose dehydrogenase
MKLQISYSMVIVILAIVMRQREVFLSYSRAFDRTYKQGDIWSRGNMFFESNLVTSLLPLSFVIILVLVSQAIVNTGALSYATSSPDNTASRTLVNINPDNFTKGNNDQTQYYSCSNYGVMHCDPSVSEVRSFLVHGVSSEVYLPSANLKYVEGKHGKALEMVANRAETIEINNTGSINNQYFTAAFWAKRLPESEPLGIIISHANNTNTAGWYFRMTGKGQVSFAVTNSNGTVTDTKVNNNTLIPTDRFAFVVGTFDGSKVRLFVDGQLVSEAIFHGGYVADPKTTLRIGGLAQSMGMLLWTGIIDSFSLFNQTLTEDQIKELFHSSDTSYFNPEDNNSILKASLVGTWKFDSNLDETSFSQQSSNDGISRTYIASMAFAPDSRLFFSEKNTGNIRIMKDDRVLQKPFAVISDHYVNVEQGLLGIAIDPLFEKNHYVYLYYTAISNTTNNDSKIINRLVRFTDVNNAGLDKITLIDNIPASKGFHSGGALAFGPDDKLYVTVGDATQPIYAQNPSVLLGKVLRINRDGTIPADNPYPNSPVYTIGHRNMYGIAFDNKNDVGIIAENGDVFYDEINLIRKGGNYGFPTLQPPNFPPEKANSSLSILPLRSYWQNPGPTQSIYYEGNKFAEVKNRFLVGGFIGSIYALLFDLKDDKIITEEQWISFDFYPFSAITTVAASPEGEIYFAGSAIYKLAKIDSTLKEQTVFPIELHFSSNFNKVENVEILEGENTMIIDFQTSNQSIKKTSTSSPLSEPLAKASPPYTLSIRIPKNLLGAVQDVNAMTGSNKTGNNFDNLNLGRSQPITYDIDNSTSNFTRIGIKYWPDMSYRLEINGPEATNDNINLENDALN